MVGEEASPQEGQALTSPSPPSYAVAAAGDSTTTTGSSAPLVLGGEGEQVVRVHSNYVPAQMDRHLECVEFSPGGHLLLAASSLNTRYWTGQLWYYTAPTAEDAVTCTDPSKCLTGQEMETGVVAARFLSAHQLVVGLDSGALVLVNLTREREGGRETHYLETQAPVVEHDDQLTGLDLWGEGGAALGASVGADLRVVVWSRELVKVHSYSPAHSRTITGVACSPSSPHLLATSGQEGEVKLWDTRAARPCTTLHRAPASPPSTLTWAGDRLVVGTRCGSLSLLDPRSPATPLSTAQFFDREVRRLRWSATGRLAVTADDAVVKVVEVGEGSIVERYTDTRHTDYVRGVGWRGEELWTGGWDGKVLVHTP